MISEQFPSPPPSRQAALQRDVSLNCVKREYSRIIIKNKNHDKHARTRLVQWIQWRIILVFRTEVRSPTCLRSALTPSRKKKCEAGEKRSKTSLHIHEAGAWPVWRASANGV